MPRSTRPIDSMTKKQTKLLSAVDIITLIYCGWMSVYLLLGLALRRAVDGGKHFAIHLSIITLVLLLAYFHRELDKAAKPRLEKLLSFVRGLYPVAFFGYFFTSGYCCNRILFTDWQDPFFRGIDQWLFGYLPSMVWGVKYSSFFTDELFHFAYFAYYPMIGGLPLYLYFKKQDAFKELIFSLTFVFYLCYFVYSLLPVVGGRFIPEAMEFTKTYHSGVFTHIMVFIYRNSHHLGGAFPSSHVAIALVLTMAALRHARKAGYVFVVISVFLSIATVYCHYHWFIDAVFGLFTGIGAYFLSLWVYRKLQGADI